MKNKKFRVFLEIFLGIFCLNVFAGNVSSWISFDVKKSFKNFHVGVNQESKIGVKDGQHIDEIHVTPSFMYDFSRNISVGVNYRHVLLRDGTDSRFLKDRRPGIDFVLKDSFFKGLKVSNRSRFLIRKLEGEDEYFRYRNLSSISFWKFSRFEISPFASYEWFFDDKSSYSKNDKFCSQWLSSGFSFKISRFLRPVVFYRLVENHDSTDNNWNVSHVLGLSLYFSF